MKKKILVVDDNAMMLSFITGLLKREGHDVDTVQDGFQALTYLAANTPEIIFVDLIMPRIGGDILCKIIRKIPQFDNCYIVVLSAAVMEMSPGDQDLGADKYIAKGPFGEMTEHILQAVADSSKKEQMAKGPVITGGQAIYDRQVTKELLSRTRHLETILDSIDEGILEIFSERIISANVPAVSLLGIPHENLIGTYLPRLFDEQEKERIVQLLSQGPEGRYKIDRKAPVTQNGRQLAMKKLPLRGDSETTIVMIRDVTDQNFLEMQLQHAQKMEAIGTLSTGIAHNFRNTLASILVNSQMTQMKYQENAELCENLERINKSVQSGTDLVKRLLQFSHKQQKKGFVPIVVATIINEVAQIAQQSFDRAIAVETEIKEDLQVFGDHAGLTQILMNLCNNARDVMPKGGTLRLAADRKGANVLVSVSDTGHGMSDEVAKKCFDPFFSTKDMAKGTGLGLSTSYGIAKSHKGDILVHSKQGQGTTFTVVLPIHEPAAGDS